MRLLFPEFDHTDIQTPKSRSPNSQSAKEWPSADEQPCCSKDLKDDGRERMIDREEKKPSVEEKREKENNGMTKQNGKERRDGKETEEEGHSEEEEDDDNMFMRSSGLISHSYNLDLNLNPGGSDSRRCTACRVCHVLVNTTNSASAKLLMFGSVDHKV